MPPSHLTNAKIFLRRKVTRYLFQLCWDVSGTIPPQDWERLQKRQRIHPPGPVPGPTQNQVTPPGLEPTHRPTSPRSSTSGSTVKFPESRASTSMSDPKAEPCLQKFSPQLLTLNAFADEKVKALTIFGAHQYNALWLPALKLDPWTHSSTKSLRSRTKQSSH